MSSSALILAALALLPAAVLMLYIYKMDRAEKEPAGLLTGLFFLGVLSVIPTVIFESLFGNALNTAFDVSSETDLAYMSVGALHLYQIINNFICIALIEEFFKWLFAFLPTRRNKNFNSLFDGVVYTVFVSLGFAAAENLLYVFEGGVTTALLRMVTAVPGHCFFGVIMGYFYSRWALEYRAAGLESHLRAVGVIPPGPPAFRSARLLALSIIVPALAHGLYDFCATMGYWVYLIGFFVFLIFLYVVCFSGVHKLSKADNQSSFLAMDMVLRRYPYAAAYVSTLPAFAVYFYPPVAPPVSYGRPFAPVTDPAQPFAQPMNAQPFAQPMNAQPFTPPPSQSSDPRGDRTNPF